ncbi:MAG: phosphopantetheine-binding protein [Isosphaeraceae bacterium]|nr:phosphopantetheine-binding protein [Isosphaeraceae bacterium]
MTSDEHSTKEQIRQAVVRVLGLGIEPESLAFDEPLFGGERPLDSIDLVACIVTIEHMFDFEFPESLSFTEELRTIDAMHAAVARFGRARLERA